MAANPQDALANSSTEVAIITTDLTGNITVFNAGAEKMLGFSAAEVIGKHSPVDFHDTAEFNEAALLLSTRLGKKLSGFNVLKELALQNEFKPKEWTYYGKHQHAVKVRLDISAIQDDNNKTTGLLFMAKAINGRRTLELTALPDRDTFEKILDREFRRMQREDNPISLVKIDVDFFAAYQEEYGQAQAQYCLTQLAYIFNENVQRAGDVLTYYGDTQFMIILPNTDKPGAVKVAERLRLLTNNLKLEHTTSEIDGHLTVSVGIATLLPDRDTKMSVLVNNVERGLQQAKADGHNCSRIA